MIIELRKYFCVFVVILMAASTASAVPSGPWTEYPDGKVYYQCDYWGAGGAKPEASGEATISRFSTSDSQSIRYRANITDTLGVLSEDTEIELGMMFKHASDSHVALCFVDVEVNGFLDGQYSSDFHTSEQQCGKTLVARGGPNDLTRNRLYFSVRSESPDPQNQRDIHCDLSFYIPAPIVHNSRPVVSNSNTIGVER